MKKTCINCRHSVRDDVLFCNQPAVNAGAKCGSDFSLFEPRPTLRLVEDHIVPAIACVVIFLAIYIGAM